MAGKVILFLGTGGPRNSCLSFPVFQKKLGNDIGKGRLVYLGGEVIQLVKPLPYNQEELSLIHRAQVKELGVVVTPVSPPQGRRRLLGLWCSLAGQSDLLSKFQAYSLAKTGAQEAFSCSLTFLNPCYSFIGKMKWKLETAHGDL